MDELRKQRLEDVVKRLARFTLEGNRGGHVSRAGALNGISASIDAPPGDPVRAKSLELPCSDQVTLDDALSALLLVPDEREYLDRMERELIEAAMDRGATWEQVGSFYRRKSDFSFMPPQGITKQSIQRHYRRLGGTKSWPTRRPAAALPADRDTASDQ